MRVIVNQLPALGIKTGIGHYTTELLRCLRAGWGRPDRRIPGGLGSPRQASGGPGSTLPRRPAGAGRIFHSFAREAANRRLPADAPLRRGLMAQYFRLVYRLGRYDLYHEPNFIPLACDNPTVATLHDLSVLYHPEWHPADRASYFEKNFHRGIARCIHFLAISEFGRQEVIRKLNIPPQKVTRTYMGIRSGLGPLPAAEVERVLRQLDLPPRYLLYLGTIEPRKNILLLLARIVPYPRRCGALAAIARRQLGVEYFRSGRILA